MTPRNTRAPRSRTTVLRRLAAICSYTAALHVHLNGPTGRFVDLEELARTEAERAGDQVRRELADRRVQTHDLVVVELPRVRDLRLGPGQLLLEREEVLAGLEIRVVL